MAPPWPRDPEVAHQYGLEHARGNRLSERERLGADVLGYRADEERRRVGKRFDVDGENRNPGNNVGEDEDNLVRGVTIGQVEEMLGQDSSQRRKMEGNLINSSPYQRQVAHALGADRQAALDGSGGRGSYLESSTDSGIARTPDRVARTSIKDRQMDLDKELLGPDGQFDEEELDANALRLLHTGVQKFGSTQNETRSFAKQRGGPPNIDTKAMKRQSLREQLPEPLSGVTDAQKTYMHFADSGVQPGHPRSQTRQISQYSPVDHVVNM